ncbi:hypothetical protein B0H16DRAFT_1676394 [Mycena metata]|uniref:Carbohydrate esterase family 16 protein n=1 Tax=Mycena metata TaxID=1033252 RepID=A0AAD7ID76_9AGAR|nr:hypothetical protein B0H16DRAFT_1676394 [Mycena metata]
MTSQFPSTIVNNGPSWQGFNKLTFLVVFGASYCDVGYSHRDHPVPSADEPLGIKFPGVTFAEAGQPNWVGHLVKEFAASNKSASPLVYNYAYGGSRVHDVRFQIQDVFVPHIGRRPDGAQWKAENTLFITWVGINDAAWGSDHGHNLEKFFEAQQTLYDCGARNFMFVNVPPIDRAPAKGKKPNYIAWNVELQNASSNFANTHPDAMVLIYSAYDTFNAILDDPVAYGFAPEDAAKAGGPMWVDHLHPSSKVHGFVARDMMSFLSGIKAS